jgi:hypothetical protein
MSKLHKEMEDIDHTFHHLNYEPYKKNDKF